MSKKEPQEPKERLTREDAMKAYRAACQAENEHPCRAHAQATDAASRAVYRAIHG